MEFKLSGNPALERRDLAVVLYCKTSGRAALAARAMHDMGYLNVQSLAGGFDACAMGQAQELLDGVPVDVVYYATFCHD